MELTSPNQLMAHEGVHRFIQKVQDQLLTETDGMAIQDEMLDHIQSLVEEYLAAGHSYDMSINKALVQMGDPAEIGYSFTDYDAMKRRKFLRIGFKIASLILFIGTILILIGLSGGWSSLTVSQSSDSSGEYTPDFLGLFYTVYFPLMIFTNIKSQSMVGMAGISMNHLKISKEPLMILWPYKKTFPWEYLLLTIFFAPIVIVFILLFAYEGNNPVYAIGFIGSIITSIGLIIHSEKYRIPKYMIIEEGIVIKNNLITWSSIDKVSWTRDYRSPNNNHHVLVLEHVYRNDVSNHNRHYYTYKKTIGVNHHQYKQVNAIIKEHLS